jgi:nicotinamidase-related amidase
MNIEGPMMELAVGGGLWRAAIGALLATGGLAAVAASSNGPAVASILEVWDKVKAPPPPQVKAVDVAPGTTALLILDIEARTTNRQRRPRAVASVPRIAALLAKARAAGMPVAYSLTRSGTRETILKEVAPRPGEPVVKASVDKFHGTELEAFLKKKGVKTVLIVGTAAEGAVLHTATAAAVRGFGVVVPLDGMSSSELYAEQYTAWHLANAPGSRRRTTLTTTNRVRIKE